MAMPKKRVLAVAVAVALGGPAFEGRAQSIAPNTLPTGGQVVGGQASITQSGASMNVLQTTSRAAIDWQSFSIGSQAAVRFDQPSASAIALNRVLGNNASEIYGRLSANGQVFLVNPNGVLFARTAQVDVGSLLTSTLGMSSDDFMAGRYILRNFGTAGSIVNQGTIKSAPGGYVAFVGPTLTNDGTIESPSGTVSLTAAKAATMEFMADGLVRIRVDERALESEITNNGALRADGGGVFITATGVDNLARAVVNNTGIIEARSVETVNGVVRLGGGQVEIAGNTVTVDGRVDVSATEGSGGSIKVLGDKVALVGRAELDASGAQGGGQVLVGGNYQGKGPEQNASQAFVGKDVTIDASARTQGDGGKVIVWSDEGTQFHGHIAARGGAQSGNGGFVETSGATLTVTGGVNTSAPNGRLGKWLLDPTDLTVADALGVDVVTTGSINAAVSDVILQADNDITFVNSVHNTNSPVSLTADAGRSIIINPSVSIQMDGGDVTLTANSESVAIPANRQTGAATLTMGTGSQIAAPNGMVSLRIGTGSGSAPDQSSGNMVIENVTANDVSIIHDGATTDSSILRASLNSLITGTNAVFMELEFASGANASIGTPSEPIRLSTPVLEAHYHAASGGIYLESPNAGDVQIGGVPFFGGSVRGVQAVSGGDVQITVNGNLTTQFGTAGCAVAGTGGPICGDNVVLNATGSINLNHDLVASGEAWLFSGTGVTAGGIARIDANALFVDGGTGNVDLLGNNLVGTLAAAGGGHFYFHNAQNLTIDTVDGFAGITMTGTGGTASDVFMTAAGDLTILQPISTASISNPTGNAYTAVKLHIDGGITASAPITTGNASGISTDSSIALRASFSSPTMPGSVAVDQLMTGNATSSNGPAESWVEANAPSGKVTTGSITTGVAQAGGLGDADSTISLLAGGALGNGQVHVTGSLSTGAANGESADSSVFAQSLFDFIAITGNVTTGGATGSEANSFVHLGAPGDVSVGNITTLDATASGPQPANSYVIIDGANVTAGSITTGDATATSESAFEADSRVRISATGDLATNSIHTGHATNGGSDDAYSSISVSAAGSVVINGDVASGDSTNAYSAESSVTVDSNTGTTITGNVSSGLASATTSTADSEIELYVPGGNLLVGGTIHAGDSTGATSANASVDISSAGTLDIGAVTSGSASAAGPSNSNVSIGAALDLVADAVTTGTPTGTTKAVSVAIESAGGNVTLNGPITIANAAPVTNSATLGISASGSVTLNSSITVEASIGSADVDMSGDSVVANGAVINVIAGSAGGAGIHPANVSIQAGGGGINWGGGSITANGGNDSFPANKDDANISLASSGAVNVTSTTFTASGFNPDIEIDAIGNVIVSNSTLQASAVRETATIFVYSSGGFVSLGNSVLSATGAEPGTIGNDADTTNVTVVAQQDVALTNTSIAADAGTGVGEALLYAGSTVDFGLGQINAAGTGDLNINAGSSISSTSGGGGSHSGTLGRAVLTGNNVTVAAGVPVTVTTVNDGILAIDAFGAANVSGSLTATSTGGQASVDIAGPTFAWPEAQAMNLAPGGSITVNALGVATVSAEISGDITLGGNISTSGQVIAGPDANTPGLGGIFLSAGGAIISGGGILTAASTSGPSAHIALTAVNGIGTPADPIRMQGDSNGFMSNASTGDIALSFVTGELDIQDLSAGFLNSNPNGTYYFRTENGNLALSTSFTPNSSPLLAGQSVWLEALTGSVSINASGSIQTFGTGNITLSGNNLGNGFGAFVAGNLQASGTGNISITGVAHGAGAGVFITGAVNAFGGDITIDGFGGNSSDANFVAGVHINPSSGQDIFGQTVQITGHGGTATGTGSAQGVSINNVDIDGDEQVTITGIGGTSATAGAGGVLIVGGSHVGGNGAGVTIAGTAGTAGGNPGGAAVGVLIGSQSDVVGSDLSTTGLLTITGIGGTGNNVSATGVAVFGPTGSQSVVESLGGIVINGTGGNVNGGTGSAVGVSLQNTLVATASAIGDPTVRNIFITGEGGQSQGGGNATGIGVTDGAVIQTQGIDVPDLGGFQTGFGDITLNGVGGTAATTGSSNGVTLSQFNTPNGGSIFTNTGSVSITGIAGDSATGEARGIVMRAGSGGSGSTIESTGGGAISLTGVGGASTASGTASTTGVAIGGQAGSPSLVRTSGNIDIDGTGGDNSGTTSASGVGVSDGSTIQATGAGNLTITGQGGSAGAGGAHGIVVAPFNTSFGASVLTDSGSLELNGFIGTASGPSLALRVNDSVVSTNSGPMTISATGDVAIVASNAALANMPTTVHSGGTQFVTVSGALTVQGAATGSNASAGLVSAGDQTISAGSITVLGGDAGGVEGAGNFAQISSFGTQSITTDTDLTLTAGAVGVNNFAVVLAPTQDITVHGNLSLTGGGSDPIGLGSGSRIGGFGGVSPTATNLTLQVDGNATLVGGSNFPGATGSAIGSSGVALAQTTDINATIGGDLLMTQGALSGTTFGSPSNSTAGGNVMLAVGGDVVVTGGNTIHSAGMLDIAATGNMTLTAGSGTNQSAVVLSGGDQTVSAASITLNGGSAGSNNIARIYQTGAGSDQTVTAATIVINGGADGGGFNTGNFAQIRNDGDAQIVNVGAGGLHLTGGGGSLTDNSAGVFQAGTSGTQTINVSGGGSILLQGGSSAQASLGTAGSHGSFAVITSDGVSQEISFLSGGSIDIQGGTVGSRNSAGILARTAGATQTISGSPTVSLTGGATGGVDFEGNTAFIQSTGGQQTITAGAASLTAGSGGISNAASIIAPSQTITVHGSLTITGGDSAPGATGAGARIGGLGGGTPSPTSLTLDVDNNLTLTGGGIAGATGAAIGSASSAAQPTGLDITVGGEIVLNPGSASGVRIGSSEANPGGGNIAITAANLTLNDNGTVGSLIHTLGDVAIDVSGAIAEAPLSRIAANALTANAQSGISLDGNNNVATFIASNTSLNGIQFTQSTPFTIGGISQSGGDVTITADDLNISGSVDAGANNVILRPLTLSRDIAIQGGDVGGALSLSTSDLSWITANTLEVGRNDNTGTGTLTIGALPTGINAPTLKFYAQNINMTGGVGGTGAEYAHSLELRASNNVSITDSTILLADGASLALVADNDNSGAGDLTISNSDSIGHRTILAGTSASNTASMLLQGHNISVTDTAGTTMTVVLRGTGTQTVVSFGADNATTIQGGSIEANEGTQQVDAVTLNVLGGNTFGHLWGASQTISATHILVRGGSGTGNDASIQQVSPTGTQTINLLGVAPSLTVQGGDGAAGNNDASVSSQGTLQQINAAGATLTITGGANGTVNSAHVSSKNSGGSLVITGAPDITLQGGTGGQENSANLDAAGTLTVSAGSITVAGGSGLDAHATMGGQSVGITYNGTVQLTGGTGNGAFAGIGNGEMNTTVSLTGAPGSGTVALTGGSGGIGSDGVAADALIGAVGGFNADVTIAGQADISLSKGGSSGFGARIGSDTAGGNVLISAGQGGSGALVMIGGQIRTADDVTLQANGDIVFYGASLAANHLTLSPTGVTLIPFGEGTTTFATTSPFNNTGTLVLASGATLSTNGGDLVNTATGVIFGDLNGPGTFSTNTSTIDLGGGTLTNNGVVRPGGAGVIGAINVVGNYVQGAGGALAMDLASGSSYDVLAVSGAATLGGTLDVNYLGGYLPSGLHNIVTYASQTGTFATINDAQALAPTYGPTLFSIGDAFNTWVSLLGGDWTLGSNWSFGHAPTAAEDARVPDLAGTQTITLASSAQTPRSVLFLGDEQFSLTGGSLTLTSASSLANGTLNIGGGSVVANGDLLAKNFLLSSGSLTGSGNVTVTDSYLHTGGTFSIAGIANITQLSGNLALGAVGASALGAHALSGGITGTTSVGTLAASASGPVSIVNTAPGGTLTIGSVASLNGVSGAGVAVTETSGDVSILQPVNGGASGVFISADGADRMITNASTVAGSGGVTLSADKMSLASGSVNAGGSIAALYTSSINANIVLGSSSDLLPGTLELSNAEVATVSAGTLQIGRIESTGSLTSLTQPLNTSDVNAATLRLVAGDINIGGSGGFAFGFDRDLELFANNNLNPGSFTLADGRNLTLTADRDHDFIGDVILSGSVQVGTTAANTGSMTISGENLQVLASGSSNAMALVNGSGTQVLNANFGIVIDNTGSGSINVSTQTGSQTVSAGSGNITIDGGTGAGGSVNVGTSGGNQSVTAGGGITIRSRAGGGSLSNAGLNVNGGNQTVSAQYVELIANGSGDASIWIGGGTGTQAITTAGANALGVGVLVQSSSPTGEAYIQTNGSGLQSITVNGGGNDLRVTGGAGAARIAAFNGAQTLQVAGMIDVGGNTTTGTSAIQASGLQTLQADEIILHGGNATGATAQINTTAAQNITTGSGGLVLAAGSAAGGGANASIFASTTQSITVNGGGVSVLGGTNGANQAAISSAGAQTITQNNGTALSIIGQDGTADIGSSGAQTVTLQGSGANALIIGGASAANRSSLSGQSQVITVGTSGQSGSITLIGGAGIGNSASIFANGGAQTVSSAGTITMLGGTAAGAAGAGCGPTGGSCAIISKNGPGAQTISANALFLTGGASGSNNLAGLFVNGGPQFINAGSGGLLLIGGAGGTENSAVIGGGNASGQTLTLNVAGNASLMGGAGDSATAFIGLGGAGSNGTITVNFTGAGSLTMAGGTGVNAAAAIGAGGNQTSATSNVTVSAASVTLNDSASTVARIGHSSAANGAGNIAVTATAGNIALNSASGPGSAIRTKDNVTLTASGAITEGAASVVAASQLTTSAGSTTSLGGNNAFAALNATGAGNVTIKNTAPSLTLTGMSPGSGAVVVNNTGSLDVAGTVGGTGDVTLVSTGSISGAGLVQGANVVLDGATGVGSSGGSRLNTAAGSLAARASSSGGVFVAEADSVTLTTIGGVPNSVVAANTYDLSAGGAITVKSALTAGTLVLASTGAVSNSAGALINVANNASLSGASIDLGNQAGDIVNFGSLQYSSTGNVAVSEDSATVVTGSNTAGSLALASTGAITDAASTSQVISGNATFTGTSITLVDNPADVLSVGGTATFNATGGGAITIALPGTANFGAVTFSTTGAVGITEDSATSLAGASAAGSLILGSAGAITNASSATLNVSGNANLTGSSITLGSQAGDAVNVGSLTYFSAGAVAIATDSAVVITGANNNANGLTLASTGAITDAVGTSQTITNNAVFTGASITLADNASDVLSIGGTATFNATGGGAVSIPAASTANFGSLAFNTTGTVAITEDSATNLAGVSTAGSLTLASAGALTNATSASLSVAGTGNLGASSINLGNQSGDTINFGTLTFNSAGAVNIAEDSSMTLVGTSTGNPVVLTAASITGSVPQDLITGELTLNTANGVTALATHVGTPLVEGGLTVNNSGNGDVNIHNVGLLNVRTVNNVGGGFILDNTGDVRVSVPANTGGAFKITAHSDIAIQADINANATGLTSGPAIDLQATSPGSVITQASGTTLNANNGTIVLASSSDVMLQGSLSGGTASVTTSGGDVQLGTTSTSGALTVSTGGGDITQSGVLNVGGTSSLQASTGNVTLSDSGNSFTGAVSATGTGTSGITIVTSGTLIPASINAGTSGLTLDATTLASGGPLTAGSATLGSDNPVSGVTLNASTLTLTGAATNWTFLTDSPPTLTNTGLTVTFTPITVAVAPPVLNDIITSTISNTSTSTTASSSSSTTSPTSAVSFSTTLAPDAASSPVQILSTPTAAPSETSTTTSSTTSSTSSSTTSSTQSTEPAQETGSSSSSSSSSGEGGEKQQTASVQRSNPTQPGRTTLTAAAAQLVASMNELRAQKSHAIEKGVEILERNPAAADLKPCAGAQLAGDCIAERPARPRASGPTRHPSEANLPQIQRKVALLIGVSDYRGAIPKLNSPLRDIQDIGKIYREQFGYEVRMLPNADKARIVRELNRLILESGPEDSVTVFYAGHGQIIEKTGRGYWIPARASADDPTQWISNQDIGKALQNIAAKQVLLVSDSCYSGTLTRDAKVRRAEVLTDPTAVLEKRSVTVLSSGGEEPVADAGRDGHSVFAWHFMQTLRSVEKWSNGIDVYERLTGSVTQEFPQEPQYGEALGSGHERGGDFLFEVRRY